MSAPVLSLTPADRAEINDVVQSLVRAWHDSDAEAFASAFAEDADFYNVFAHKLSGQAQIASHHALLFATVYRGSRISDVDVSIRPIEKDVATVAWSCVLHVNDEKRPAHALIVVARQARHWKIYALHNMAPLTMPETVSERV